MGMTCRFFLMGFFLGSVLKSNSVELVDAKCSVLEVVIPSGRKNIVISLIEDKEGKKINIHDPFLGKSVSKAVGNNFNNLSQLLSPDQKLIVFPLGNAEALEIYAIDKLLLQNLENNQANWSFEIVTSVGNTSPVISFGGWKGGNFSFLAELGGIAEEVECDVNNRTIINNNYKAINVKSNSKN